MALFGNSHLAPPSDGYNATTLRYDSTLVRSEAPLPHSRALRLSSSSSSSKAGFTQRLEDVQDDADRAHSEHSIKIACAAPRQLCSQLGGLADLISDLQSHSGDIADLTTSRARPTKILRKRRLNLYEDEDEGEGEGGEPAMLSVKLKKVEATVKFQKQLLQPRHQQLPTDPSFPNYISTSIQPHTPLKHAHHTHNYSPHYTLLDDANILSKHAASTLLKSRFTTSGSTASKQAAPQTSSTTGTRTITKLEINPLLLKRLGI